MFRVLERLVDAVASWLGKPSRRAVAIHFTRAAAGGVIAEGVLSMFRIPNTYDLVLAIAPVDAKGQPAPVDGVPVWSSSDDTVAIVQPAVDGLSCLVVPQVPVSAGFQVRVEADADLGAGVRTLQGSLELEIGPSEAVALGIGIGELVPKAV